MKGSPGMKQQPGDDYESESSTSSDNSAETEYGDNNEEVLKTDLVLSGSPGSIYSIGNSGVSQKELEEDNTLLKNEMQVWKKSFNPILHTLVRTNAALNIASVLKIN